MIEVGTMVLFLIAFSAVLLFFSISHLLLPLFCVGLVGFPVGILLIARLQQSARDWVNFMLVKMFTSAQKSRVRMSDE